MIASMSDKKTAPSSSLEEIRQQIDALDDAIHDALMARAALVGQIAAEKKKKKMPIVQPAREARVIRRILGRHQGALPKVAVVRIWREMFGAISMLQNNIKVAAASESEASPLWELSRDYFGGTVPVARVSTALPAISLVREGKADFAVVPWPEDGETQPWWSYLGADQQGPRMNILVRLPHGDDPSAHTMNDHRALIVGKSGYDESGDDHSFLLIKCSGDVSRGRLVDHAKKIGLEALSLVSSRPTGPYTPAMHLMEVKGFLAADNECFKAFADLIEDNEAQVSCVGGYPVPPSYPKSVHPAQTAIPSAPREEAAE